MQTHSQLIIFYYCLKSDLSELPRGRNSNLAPNLDHNFIEIVNIRKKSYIFTRKQDLFEHVQHIGAELELNTT